MTLGELRCYLNSLAQPFPSAHYYYITEALGLKFLGRLKTVTISAVLYIPQYPVLQGKSMVWRVLACEIIPMKPAELQGSSRHPPPSSLRLCRDKIEVFYFWSLSTPVLAPCSLTPVLYCLATGKHKSCP